MIEIIRGMLSFSEISVSDEELSARLGRKVSADEESVKKAIADISCVSNPTFVATRVKISEVKEDNVVFDGFSVFSASLSRYFSGASESFMFVATLGVEVDRLIAKKRALSVSDGFIYDAVASAMIEAVCDALEKRITAGEETKNRFSPGYADCPISAQKDFFKILRADKYIGVKLLDSMLMSPMKSVSAFIAIKG